MEYGQLLIDKAAKMCGSRYKLAQVTGTNEGNLSKMASGKRRIPIELVPELAELAGIDPREAVALVLADQLPEDSKARAILGKGQAAGVAVMLLFLLIPGLLLPSHACANESLGFNPIYIVEYQDGWPSTSGAHT